MNDVLKDKTGKILDFKIPGYEKKVNSLKSENDEIKNNLNNLFKFQDFHIAVHIGGLAKVSTVMGKLKVPSGYTYLGVIANNNGYGDAWQVTYSEYGNNIVAYIDSYINSTLDNSLKCKAIFVKTDYYNQNLVS